MKFSYIVVILSFLPLANISGQTNSDESTIADLARDVSLSSSTSLFERTNALGRPITSILDDSQTNIDLFVYHRQPCPLEYTNSISNTNLFVFDEQNLLQKICSKYNKLSKNELERIRLKSGDGYDVIYNPASEAATLTVQQIKHGQLNGLRVELHGDHCVCLLHFVNDKAIGEWFQWDTAGNLLLEAKFRGPYNFFGHLSFGSPQ